MKYTKEYVPPEVDTLRPVGYTPRPLNDGAQTGRPGREKKSEAKQLKKD